MALRRVHCDGKGNGDERGKSFRRAREKVAPHLAGEARWLVEYDLIGGYCGCNCGAGSGFVQISGIRAQGA
jgi:hypothetical protein